MSCGENIRREVVSLALGELAGQRAAEIERHIAGCSRCAALRAALGAERASIKAGGLPLLAAGPAFTGAAARAAAGSERNVTVGAAGFALAAGLAAVLLFGLPHKKEPPPVLAPSLTERYSNPFGASVPGEASPTDFLYSLSARTGSGRGAGPSPMNLKEGL